MIHKLPRVVLPAQPIIHQRYLQFSAIQDCQQYLNYCLTKSVNTGSTVFKGTLYELYVKSFLETKLHCTDLVKYGGSYDNGIDIIGKWNLLPYYLENEYNSNDTSKKLMSKSILKYTKQSIFNTSDSPICLNDNIQLLVQCKNYKKKPDAKIIRELSGILEYHKNFNKKSSVMFIVTPLNCTAQAITQLDNTKHAIIHLAISPLINITPNSVDIDERDEFFDLKNWSGGKLKHVYMNRYARNLFSGLNLEQQLKFIK